MRRKISGDLLDRYLRGECSPGEKEFVKNWYQSFNQDDDHVSGMDDNEKQLLRDSMYARISGLLSTDSTAKGGKVIQLKFLRYAAAIAAIAFITYLVLPIHIKQASSVADQNIIVHNSGKKIREQVLNDGSHVWLSPGAQLTYSKSFGRLDRKLSMSGEAFFEVTKNPQKPFIINSGHIITEVWGTSFRVRDARQAQFADVSVVTGKVSVSLPGTPPVNINKPLPANTRASVMLYPNQQVIYSGKDKALHASQENRADLLIWKKTNLSFDNATVRNVMPLLNKTFGLNIHTNDDSINNYYITADFDGLNFPQIMEVLHTTLNINYQIDGKNVVLIKN